MKAKTQKTKAQLIEGIDDSVWEAAQQELRAALLIAVVQDCIKDSTVKIQALLKRTHISSIDRELLLSALGEVREAKEEEATHPETYERYRALSRTMVGRVTVALSPETSLEVSASEAIPTHPQQEASAV